MAKTSVDQHPARRDPDVLPMMDVVRFGAFIEEFMARSPRHRAWVQSLAAARDAVKDGSLSLSPRAFRQLIRTAPDAEARQLVGLFPLALLSLAMQRDTFSAIVHWFDQGCPRLAEMSLEWLVKGTARRTAARRSGRAAPLAGMAASVAQRSMPGRRIVAVAEESIAAGGFDTRDNSLNAAVRFPSDYLNRAVDAGSALAQGRQTRARSSPRYWRTASWVWLNGRSDPWGPQLTNSAISDVWYKVTSASVDELVAAVGEGRRGLNELAARAETIRPHLGERSAIVVGDVGTQLLLPIIEWALHDPRGELLPEAVDPKDVRKWIRERSYVIPRENVAAGGQINSSR